MKTSNAACDIRRRILLFIFGEMFESFVFGSNNLETIPINVDPSFTGQDNVNVFNVHVAKKFGTKNANC